MAQLQFNIYHQDTIKRPAANIIDPTTLTSPLCWSVTFAALSAAGHRDANVVCDPLPTSPIPAHCAVVPSIFPLICTLHLSLHWTSIHALSSIHVSSLGVNVAVHMSLPPLPPPTPSAFNQASAGNCISAHPEAFCGADSVSLVEKNEYCPFLLGWHQLWFVCLMQFLRMGSRSLLIGPWVERRRAGRISSFDSCWWPLGPCQHFILCKNSSYQPQWTASEDLPRPSVIPRGAPPISLVAFADFPIFHPINEVFGSQQHFLVPLVLRWGREWIKFSLEHLSPWWVQGLMVWKVCLESRSSVSAQPGGPHILHGVALV